MTKEALGSGSAGVVLSVAAHEARQKNDPMLNPWRVGYLGAEPVPFPVDDADNQPLTLGRSVILTRPSWLVNVSGRSALWACATPKIR
jgi:hypothetical protein